ncbi:iron ABC transporter permease, partial [Mesorhizobium sp. M1A.F.Ca.IN.020.06.1.1]
MSAIDLTHSGPPAAARQSRRSTSWITLAAAIFSLIALLPLAFIVWVGIQTGWDTVV